MTTPSDFAESGVAPKPPTADAGPLYRVDRFSVPVAGRAEFLARVRDTHAVLRRQEGFLRDMILERPSGEGAISVVTIVEWADAAVVARVSEAVARRHAEIGFDRREMLARLGITAEIASYHSVPAA